MKTNTVVVVTSALILSSSLVLAAGQPSEQETPQPDTEWSMTKGDPVMRGGCMPMHDSMRTMHSQINEIYQAEEPGKRAELIEAHLDSMYEMMMMTKGMMMDHKMDQGMDMPAGKTD